MINVKPPEKDEEMSNRPMLRLMQGGKGPPINTEGVNWLSGLRQGAAFSCKKKGNTDHLELYCIAFKHNKTIILVDGLNTNHRFAVDPEDFCKKYNHFETIEEGGHQEPPKEEDHDSVRSVRSSELANDADAKGRQPKHE